MPYFRGLDVMFEHRKAVDFLLEVVCKHFRGYKRLQIPRFARNDNLVINRVAWQITPAARRPSRLRRLHFAEAR